MERAALSRLPAVVLLAAALAAAARERLSPFAQALRDGRPSLAWLAADDSPGLYLAIHHPTRRTLDLVFIPEETLVAPRRTLAAVRAEALRRGADPDAAAASAAAAKLAPLVPAWTGWEAMPVLRFPTGPGPLEARERVEALTQGPRFWKNVIIPPRRHERPPAGGALRLGATDRAELPFFDRLLLALELHRLPAGAVRPAWLPADDAAPAFFGRLLAPGAPAGASGRPVTVEVLNATGKPGLASQAKKILRLREADVMQTANADAPAARTVVYDRTGRFENAEAVRAMLGCAAAAAATRVDHKRLVDVTVVLAEDCPIE